MVGPMQAHAGPGPDTGARETVASADDDAKQTWTFMINMHWNGEVIPSIATPEASQAALS